jgi:hypothetical protein
MVGTIMNLDRFQNDHLRVIRRVVEFWFYQESHEILRVPVSLMVILNEIVLLAPH